MSHHSPVDESLTASYPRQYLSLSIILNFSCLVSVVARIFPAFSWETLSWALLYTAASHLDSFYDMWNYVSLFSIRLSVFFFSMICSRSLCILQVSPLSTIILQISSPPLCYDFSLLMETPYTEVGMMIIMWLNVSSLSLYKQSLLYFKKPFLRPKHEESTTLSSEDSLFFLFHLDL